MNSGPERESNRPSQASPKRNGHRRRPEWIGGSDPNGFPEKIRHFDWLVDLVGCLWLLLRLPADAAAGFGDDSGCPVTHTLFFHTIVFIHFAPSLPTTGRTYKIWKIFAIRGLRPRQENNIYCPATQPHNLPGNPSHTRSHRLCLAVQHMQMQGQAGPGWGLDFLFQAIHNPNNPKFKF